MKNKYKNGFLLRVKATFMNEPVGCVAYVYRVTRDGIWLLTENMVDIGLFSESDQEKYLEYIKDSGIIYNYVDDRVLAKDIQEKWFEIIF